VRCVLCVTQFILTTEDIGGKTVECTHTHENLLHRRCKRVRVRIHGINTSPGACVCELTRNRFTITSKTKAKPNLIRRALSTVLINLL